MPNAVSPTVREYEVLPSLNNPAIPAAAPAPEGETADLTKIVAEFGDDVLASGLHNDQQLLYIKPSRLFELASFLKKDAEHGFEALIDVTAIDCSELPQAQLPSGTADSRFHAVYQFRSYERQAHLMVICPSEGGDTPQVPSLEPVYSSAEWPEREAYDLMGVRFLGHPDPRRILMPNDWPNHPLRKDIPLGGEEVPFSFTWDNPEFSTLGQQVLEVPSEPPELPPGFNTQNMIINMGPHHPSTHGVLRLAVELDGETVVGVDPDLGYLHSGFEKTGEHKRYKDFVYYTDRMDYLSAMNNNLGYALTVEKMLGIDIPERAEIIRIIMSELQRIASHLFWLSIHALDVCGAGLSLLMYATRERERILDLFEMVCGARLTLSYIRVGGVWKDVPPAFLTNLQELVNFLPSAFDSYERMLTEAPIWRERLEGVGYLSREEVIDMGLSGPMLRGSGVDWDLRRDVPYSGYEKFDFEVPVATEGDCYARYLVRLQEMRQSVRILQQALDNLPDGLYKTDERKISLPPRAELDVSMEALIHHFKLVTEGFNVPPGMFYHGIEASKGELGFYIYSDGSGKPYRLHIHGPSFNNLYAIGKMSHGEMLSDLVTNIGSIDFVLGEVDR